MFMHIQQELVLASSWVLEKSWGVDSRFVFKEWKALWFWFYGIFKKIKTLKFTGF
jgi:hypothetical protein